MVSMMGAYNVNSRVRRLKPVPAAMSHEIPAGATAWNEPNKWRESS